MSSAYATNPLLSSQILIVVTEDWNATRGFLYPLELSEGKWSLVSTPISICIGAQGMAWGIGLHDLEDLEGLHKKEGDQKTPAGIFRLGSAFGDQEHRAFVKNFPFILIDDELECVDDPHSKFYNQFVERKSIQTPDWKSSEKMIEVGFLYSLGAVIEHNSNPPIPGKGSCIFLHIARENFQGTAGCTAMQERDLNALVSWLDIEKKPLIVQLPLQEYQQRQRSWHLPDLELFNSIFSTDN